MVQDPVCKMIIEKQNAISVLEYKGETYYFCSEDCKEAFQKDPEKYIVKPKKPESSGC